MKLEEILSLWKIDSKIDPSDLSDESQRIFVLHSKYLELLSMERMHQKLLEFEMKRLSLDKHEWLLQGHSKEARDKGWDYPAASGKIIRTDVDLYKDADKQLQELDFKLTGSQVKVDTLNSILSMISNRSYIINGMIKREIYTGGG